MKFDTGNKFIDVRAESASVEDSQIVRVTTHKRAKALTNKIVENIQAHECQTQLDDYWHRETLVMDALHLFDAHVSEHIREIYEEHRAALIHGGAYRSASAVPCQTVSGDPNAHDGNSDKESEDGFFF